MAMVTIQFQFLCCQGNRWKSLRLPNSRTVRNFKDNH
jgi:hypothetical protein